MQDNYTSDQPFRGAYYVASVSPLGDIERESKYFASVNNAFAFKQQLTMLGEEKGKVFIVVDTSVEMY